MSLTDPDHEAVHDYMITHAEVVPRLSRKAYLCLAAAIGRFTVLLGLEPLLFAVTTSRIPAISRS